MQKMLRSIAVLCASTAALGDKAPTATFTGAPATDLQMLFRQASVGDPAWLGADIATSVPLNDEGSAYLWQFGDTIIGRYFPNATRNMQHMPRNSVGVLFVNKTTGVPTSTLSHSWRLDTSNAQHVGFFTPPPDLDPAQNQWYWPQVGVRIPGQANYVIAWRIMASGSGLFPFATAGIDVIRLPDGADGSGTTSDPGQWPAQLPTTTIGSYINNNFTVGNAVTYNPDDGNVYLLGSIVGGYAIMSRISSSDFVAQNWAALTFYCADGSWKPYAADNQLAKLFDNVPSETTVTYIPSLGQWVTLCANTFISSAVTMRTAPAITGPWSDSIPVYPIPPEFTSDGGFCYAGKMHPELSPPGADEFVFTFNCNTGGLPPLVNRSSMYIPQAIRVTWA